MLNNIFGNSEVKEESDVVEPYLIDGEKILSSVKLFRDEIVFSNFGIYVIDVQGATDKKKQVTYYPEHIIESVSFESAGHFDMDVEITIHLRNKEKIDMKIARQYAAASKEIVMLMKTYYF